MNRLQALRTEKGINMKEAAQALSMPYTTYVNYEKGTREPSSEVLIKLAKFYDTSIDYLVGKVERVAPIPAGFQPLPKRDRIPRVGQIACGTPILAEENVEAYDEVPQRVACRLYAAMPGRQHGAKNQKRRCRSHPQPADGRERRGRCRPDRWRGHPQARFPV